MSSALIVKLTATTLNVGEQMMADAFIGATVELREWILAVVDPAG
jgi:hypothetical protein